MVLRLRECRDPMFVLPVACVNLNRSATGSTINGLSHPDTVHDSHLSPIGLSCYYQVLMEAGTGIYLESLPVEGRGAKSTGAEIYFVSLSIRDCASVRVRRVGGRGRRVRDFPPGIRSSDVRRSSQSLRCLPLCRPSPPWGPTRCTPLVRGRSVP